MFWFIGFVIWGFCGFFSCFWFLIFRWCWLMFWLGYSLVLAVVGGVG